MSTWWKQTKHPLSEYTYTRQLSRDDDEAIFLEHDRNLLLNKAESHCHVGVVY